EGYEVALFRADCDIDFAARPDSNAARVHLGRVHPSEVFHCAGLRVEAHDFRLRIRAGVELPVLADVVLPEVVLGRRWFADDFDSFLRLLRIEAQNQGPAPGAEVNLFIRPDGERPSARPLRRVESPRFTAVGLNLHEEKFSAELIEIEVKGFTAAPVRSDKTAHQAAFAHGNSKWLEAPGVTC